MANSFCIFIGRVILVTAVIGSIGSMSFSTVLSLQYVGESDSLQGSRLVQDPAKMSESCLRNCGPGVDTCRTCHALLCRPLEADEIAASERSNPAFKGRFAPRQTAPSLDISLTAAIAASILAIVPIMLGLFVGPFESGDSHWDTVALQLAAVSTLTAPISFVRYGDTDTDCLEAVDVRGTAFGLLWTEFLCALGGLLVLAVLLEKSACQKQSSFRRAGKLGIGLMLAVPCALSVYTIYRAVLVGYSLPILQGASIFFNAIIVGSGYLNHR